MLGCVLKQWCIELMLLGIHVFNVTNGARGGFDGHGHAHIAFHRHANGPHHLRTDAKAFVPLFADLRQIVCERKSRARTLLPVHNQNGHRGQGEGWIDLFQSRIVPLRQLPHHDLGQECGRDLE